MAEPTVPTSENEGKPAATREETRCLRPPVDIYETDDALVVVADLPGVAKAGVDIRVDSDILSIHGKPDYSIPGEELRHEFELLDFRREFQLGQQIDREKIEAQLKNGVLTLTLPKAEQAKPRKITVKTE
jgi:HSP20 family molecular chaperone IbpA